MSWGPQDERLMDISIMMTTCNRVNDLRRTLQKLRTLDPAPNEILVTADGCTDGTVEFINATLPGAKLIVNPSGIGSVASRNRMIREAKGDLVLALDDDSYPEESDCIARFVLLFRQRTNLAVLHFPQRSDEYPDTLTQTDFGREKLTRSFPNSGAVLRRSVYLELQGFEPKFYHMYEEPDYALQCVAAGYDVLFSPVITIRHHYSGEARDEMSVHHRHARNEFWSTLMRCPFPFALAMLIWRVLSQFRYACKRGWSWAVCEPFWWAQALAGTPYCLRKRKPVSWASYKRWLALP
jgi:GT2 family glycosyltransferase